MAKMLNRDEHILILSQEELNFLCDVLGNVGGDGELTRRGIGNGIAKVINGSCTGRNLTDIDGAIYFTRVKGKRGRCIGCGSEI
jgi:hypothetical protein